MNRELCELVLCGMAVIFSSAESPDRTGSFFTPATDFGFDDICRVSVFVDHGMGAAFGKRRIGIATLERCAEGVSILAHLQLEVAWADAFTEAVKAGILAWSTGSVKHLREVTSINGAHRIDTWIIGEVSLTAAPADARTVARLVKPCWS